MLKTFFDETHGLGYGHVYYVASDQSHSAHTIIWTFQATVNSLSDRIVVIQISWNF